MGKRLERGLYIIIFSAMSFFLGVFYTFYEIDQRIWNEELVKARDIENFDTEERLDFMRKANELAATQLEKIVSDKNRQNTRIKISN